MPKPSDDRAERMRENWLQQGGRPQRRTNPDSIPDTDSLGGPGKRADEKIISLPIDEILPDRYQGRLRWAIEVAELDRLYGGEWDAQELLSAIHQTLISTPTPALQEAWQATLDLAHSILAEGQVAPITIYPQRNLPSGYRYLIETGEGRYWAYQLMRWLSENDTDSLLIPQSEWKEDPHYIRAVAISTPSRLRQVAENEQRQSYPSAVDRAIAYASMFAEDAGYEVTGPPPGIHNGQLQLPDAYRRAAARGLRGRQNVIQQLPASKQQIHRHLTLLTKLDAMVLARAKEHGLTESVLRESKILTQPPEVQRVIVDKIIKDKLSSRAAATLYEEEEGSDEAIPDITFEEEEILSTTPTTSSKVELTIDEEVARLLRSLTKAVAWYEKLRADFTDNQLAAYLEVQLRSFDEGARGSKRATTPRRRIQRLRGLLEKLE
jgi:hypothetical protein